MLYCAVESFALEHTVIAQDLLAILRCPHCVSGPTRAAGDDPGRLVLVKAVWLVCQEPGCDRKYPIREDIPDMRIESGTAWIATPAAALPDEAPALT